MYYYGRGVPQDYAEAVTWYRKAAEQGDAKAQSSLGFMYHEGKGVTQDFAEAVTWYRKAAEQGDPRGQSALGYAYDSGQGVPLDYAEAFRWYREAAKQGYALAQQAVGSMYFEGQGVPQDDTQAVAWYRKAAEQGDATAQQSLGYMYAKGRGVSKDYAEAMRWYRRAADQGDARARASIEALGNRTRPPTTIRYLELSMALVTLTGGLSFLWSSVSFLRRGGRLLNWRLLAGILLSLDLLAYSGMSFYAFAQDIRSCWYYDAFHLARVLLRMIAFLLLAALFLSARHKKIPQTAAP